MLADKRESSPRPDFYREAWIDLNGSWKFAFDDEEKGMSERWYEGHTYTDTIQVPFCYQSECSGIGDTGKHFYLWYERSVNVTEAMRGKKVWLHFGAVDYETKVFVDGRCIGGHIGGFASHSYEITEYINWQKESFTLTVYCKDDDAVDKPRGKQHWEEKTDRCWYTATSGIWQNVWMELTDGYRVEHMKIMPDIDKKNVEIDFLFSEKPADGCLKWKLSYQGKEKKSGQLTLQKQMETLIFSVENEDPIDNKIHLWEPEHPEIYELEIEVYEKDVLQDRVETYFGMRKIEVKDGHIYLNHYPLYQRLVLDQGYWKESLMTPPAGNALQRDLQLVKDMGFNGVRKHQKIEDPKFLYYADKMGILVWEEMPSMYEFTDRGMERFTREYMQILQRDCNHPCIISWIPFNESWGIRDVLFDKKQQQFAEAVYLLTKAFDSSRLVGTNDGWESVRTDFVGIHDYEDRAEKLRETYADRDKIVNDTAVGKMICSEAFTYGGEAILISEYGGIAMEDGKKESWGYHDKVKDVSVLGNKIKSLTEAVKSLPYVVGYCYTQLTDVEQETNGLLYADRTPKMEIEKIREIFADI